MLWAGLRIRSRPEVLAGFGVGLGTESEFKTAMESGKNARLRLKKKKKIRKCIGALYLHRQN